MWVTLWEVQLCLYSHLVSREEEERSVTICLEELLSWAQHVPEHPSSEEWPPCSSKPRGFRDSLITHHATNVFISLPVLYRPILLDNVSASNFLPSSRTLLRDPGPQYTQGGRHRGYTGGKEQQWAIQVRGTTNQAMPACGCSAKVDALKSCSEGWATAERELTEMGASACVSSQAHETDWTLYKTQVTACSFECS